MSDNPLRRLSELGQSVWYDYIRRDLLTGGGLEQLDPRGRALGHDFEPDDLPEGDRRDGALRRRHPPRSPGREATAAIFEGLAVADVQRAADLFRPVYEETSGDDGFVSIEVGPHLALDTEGTIVEARALWKECGRPNVMVKIPATGPGHPGDPAVSRGGDQHQHHPSLLGSRATAR